MDRVNILGANIDNVTMDGAIDRIAQAIETKTPMQVITLNAEILYRALSEPALMETIGGADLVTPDGTGVLWAAEQLNSPLRERVTGIDLLTEILHQAPQRNWSLYFYGAKPEILEKAVENIRQIHPGIRIAGSTHGYISPEAQKDLLEDIRSKAPDILFVAMGAPRQEYWIRENLPGLPPLVAVGVGGSLDVLSGTVKRAPRLIQALRLEWLYRTVIQPSRMGRTMALPKFMKEVRREKKSRSLT